MIGWRCEVEFDAELVTALINRGVKRGSRRIGFLTRQVAQASIRDGHGSAPPGSPPRSHDGTLRRGILYDFDPQTGRTVIGPKLLKKRSENVTAATEEGGFTKDIAGRVQRVEARPFMRPAFARVLRESLAEAFGMGTSG